MKNSKILLTLALVIFLALTISVNAVNINFWNDTTAWFNETGDFNISGDMWCVGCIDSEDIEDETIVSVDVFDIDDIDIESDLNTYVDIAGDSDSGSHIFNFENSNLTLFKLFLTDWSNATITESQISDFGSYIETETDPLWSENFTLYNSTWSEDNYEPAITRTQFIANASNVSWNATPDTNITYLIGNATHWFTDLFVQTLHFTTLITTNQIANFAITSVKIAIGAVNATHIGIAQINASHMSADFNTSYDNRWRGIGNHTFNGNVTVNGNITADYYYGLPIEGSIGSGIINSSSNKVHCGCINVTDEGGTDVKYPELLVRIVNISGSVKYCNISSATVTVPNNQHTVYYIDNNCIINHDTWDNYFNKDLNPGDYVRIFDVYTNNGDIEGIKGATLIELNDRKTRRVDVETNHLSVVDGMDIEMNTFPNINQTAGHFIYINSIHTTQKRTSDIDGIHLVHHINSTNWNHTYKTGLNLTHCDNGTDIIPCPNNRYRRYVIYNTGWGTHTQIHQLAPVTTPGSANDYTFQNLGDCLNIENEPISYTLPPGEDTFAVVTHVYCAKRDDSAWRNGWIDIRGNAGALGSFPDTSIFLTTDGARPLTANWDAGNFNITAQWLSGIINWNNLTNVPKLGNTTAEIQAAEGDPLWTENLTAYNDTWKDEPNWNENFTLYNSSWSEDTDTWNTSEEIWAVCSNDTFIDLMNTQEITGQKNFTKKIVIANGSATSPGIEIWSGTGANYQPSKVYGADLGKLTFEGYSNIQFIVSKAVSSFIVQFYNQLSTNRPGDAMFRMYGSGTSSGDYLQFYHGGSDNDQGVIQTGSGGLLFDAYGGGTTGIRFITKSRNPVGMELDESNVLYIESLEGTYSGGQAYVCVHDDGTLFASDSAC